MGNGRERRKNDGQNGRSDKKSERQGDETEMKMLLAEEEMVVAMTAATECEGWRWCDNEADEQALML